MAPLLAGRLWVITVSLNSMHSHLFNFRNDKVAILIYVFPLPKLIVYASLPLQIIRGFCLLFHSMFREKGKAALFPLPSFYFFSHLIFLPFIPPFFWRILCLLIMNSTI